MVTRANPASVVARQSPAALLPQLRLALAMAGMAGGALGYILLDSRSWDEQWHQQHPGSGASGALDPSWIVILWAVLPLVPYILSWFLLSMPKVLYIGAGAGVAGAAAGESVVADAVTDSTVPAVMSTVKPPVIGVM